MPISSGPFQSADIFWSPLLLPKGKWRAPLQATKQICQMVSDIFGIISLIATVFWCIIFLWFCPRRSCDPYGFRAASFWEIGFYFNRPNWSVGIFENKETSQFQIRFIIIHFITLSSVMCQFLLVPSEVLIYFGPHCCFRKENDVLLYNRLSKHVKSCQMFLKSFPWLL